jgi:opacity protein-like surface antigen
LSENPGVKTGVFLFLSLKPHQENSMRRRNPHLLLAIASLILSALVLNTPHAAQASEPGTFRLGLVGGQVGLLGDPGTGGANSVGYGASAGYRLDDRVALEIQYVASSHSQVHHRNLGIGGDYYLGDYEKAYPHISAGMSFITNRFKVDDRVSDAAALYLGGGLEFELQRNLTLGPQFRYHKAFETKATVDNQEIKAVQDSYTLLIRLLYSFGRD